jgi:hypothetical protein
MDTQLSLFFFENRYVKSVSKVEKSPGGDETNVYRFVVVHGDLRFVQCWMGLAMYLGQKLHEIHEIDRQIQSRGIKGKYRVRRSGSI